MSNSSNELYDEIVQLEQSDLADISLGRLIEISETMGDYLIDEVEYQAWLKEMTEVLHERTNF